MGHVQDGVGKQPQPDDDDCKGAHDDHFPDTEIGYCPFFKHRAIKYLLHDGQGIESRCDEAEGGNDGEDFAGHKGAGQDQYFSNKIA